MIVSFELVQILLCASNIEDISASLKVIVRTHRHRHDRRIHLTDCSIWTANVICKKIIEKKLSTHVAYVRRRP